MTSNYQNENDMFICLHRNMHFEEYRSNVRDSDCTGRAEPFSHVELLHERPRPVGEIADELKIRQPQASKHLRVLSKAGLVKVYPSVQQRIYALQSKPFKELDSWLESYRELWEERLDQLDNYLTKLKKEGVKHEKGK